MGGGAFSQLVSILDMLKIKEKQRGPGHVKCVDMLKICQGHLVLFLIQKAFPSKSKIKEKQRGPGHGRRGGPSGGRGEERAYFSADWSQFWIC